MKFDESPLKQHPPPTISYDDFYSMWRTDIERIAHSYAYRFRERGWSHDETECLSSLNLVFWQSYLNWRPSSGKFGVYFWSSWNNYMASFARKVNAPMRSFDIDLTDKHDEQGYEPIPLALPSILDPIETLICQLLSEGHEPYQVRSAVGLTARQYKRSIERLRVLLSKEFER